MKYLALISALSLTACATVTPPKNPEAYYAQARVTHKAACGEVERLALAGMKLPKAIDACIKADDALDAAGSALKAGRTAQAVDATQRALVLITAAQAVLVAANGGIR